MTDNALDMNIHTLPSFTGKYQSKTSICTDNIPNTKTTHYLRYYG